ncbi:DUF6223 family protein [Streptomyces sp. NPDC057486]|uniref:DUF6223 family protein n=1 Tax=Streptomyces sp. NPDC057486 TaxID=3346145 RepID=UPI0036A402F0
MSVTFALAAPAAAHASVQPIAASVYAMTPGRLGASMAALIGLTGLVIGGLALARARRTDTGTGTARSRALVALVASPISVALGGLVVATADGGLGTGNGLGGGIVAVLVGLIGTVLGGLALARSRRTAVAADRPTG